MYAKGLIHQLPSSRDLPHNENLAQIWTFYDYLSMIKLRNIGLVNYYTISQQYSDDRFYRWQIWLWIYFLWWWSWKWELGSEGHLLGEWGGMAFDGFVFLDCSDCMTSLSGTGVCLGNMVLTIFEVIIQMKQNLVLCHWLLTNDPFEPKLWIWHGSVAVLSVVKMLSPTNHHFQTNI